MRVTVRVIGVVLFLSITCRGDDILDKLEKNFDVLSSSSSSSSSSPVSSIRAPELDAPDLLGTPIASNLAKLISNAIKIHMKPLADAKKDDALTSAATEKDDGAAEVVHEASANSNGTEAKDDVKKTFKKTNSSSSAAVEKDGATSGSSVEFAPASAEQFGELGPGSKFMEYLPDFSQISIEANGLAGVAGAGAVALMALGAIFAVPVAPVILRRTGSKGWAGLPSWRDLFSWWNSPDPVAEAWANKNQYHYEYENDYAEGGAYYANGQNYNYDSEGSSSAHQPTYHGENNHVQYIIAAPAESSEAVDYSSEQTFQASATYPDQHQRQAHQHHQQYQEQQQQYHQQQQQHQKQQQQPEEEAYEAQPFHDFRRVQRPEKVDGHELVTLEQLNRIGEESVKLLGELAKGYTTDDLYAYRDGNNQLRRRNLNTHLEGRRPQQNQRLQYQPQPSYQESVQTFSETYQREEEEEVGSNSPANHQVYQQTPEGYPTKKVFSLTQPSSDENIQEEEEEVLTSYQPEPEYKHSYSFTNPGIVSTSASAYHHEDRNRDQSKQKVSEFPYKFHKEDQRVI